MADPKQPFSFSDLPGTPGEEEALQVTESTVVSERTIGDDWWRPDANPLFANLGWVPPLWWLWILESRDNPDRELWRIRAPQKFMPTGKRLFHSGLQAYFSDEWDPNKQQARRKGAGTKFTVNWLEIPQWPLYGRAYLSNFPPENAARLQGLKGKDGVIRDPRWQWIRLEDSLNTDEECWPNALAFDQFSNRLGALPLTSNVGIGPTAQVLDGVQPPPSDTPQLLPNSEILVLPPKVDTQARRRADWTQGQNDGVVWLAALYDRAPSKDGKGRWPNAEAGTLITALREGALGPFDTTFRLRVDTAPARSQFGSGRGLVQNCAVALTESREAPKQFLAALAQYPDFVRYRIAEKDSRNRDRVMRFLRTIFRRTLPNLTQTDVDNSNTANERRFKAGVIEAITKMRGAKKARGWDDDMGRGGEPGRLATMLVKTVPPKTIGGYDGHALLMLLAEGYKLPILTPFRERAAQVLTQAGDHPLNYALGLLVLNFTDAEPGDPRNKERLAPTLAKLLDSLDQGLADPATLAQLWARSSMAQWMLLLALGYFAETFADLKEWL